MVSKKAHKAWMIHIWDDLQVTTPSQISADDTKLLTAAVMKIAEFWRMTDSKLGRVLSLPEETITQLRLKRAELDPSDNGFEAAQLILRLFFSLEAMFGDDDASACRWLGTHNVDLGARPIDTIEKRQRLVVVCE